MAILTGRRVCLVTPGHLATNPRLVKEADLLASNGYDVSVVCTRFIGWADWADAEFKSRPWRVRKVAFGPLAGVGRHVAQSGRRQAAQLIYRTSGRCAETAFHPAVPLLSRAAVTTPAELYIAHNLAALPAAARAATIHRARLAFDAEDFHRGELTDSAEHAVKLALTRELEERYLPRCEYLTAASPGIAKAYVRTCGVREPTVVLNVFPRALAPSSFTPGGSVAPSPSLYWFSQTIGPNRGLETAVEAVARSNTRPTLYLQGTPMAGYCEMLTDLASARGVSGRLTFLPPARSGELVGLAAQYDAGMALEPGTTENNQLALSNKIFTYVLAGAPVLASETSAQSRLAAEMDGALFLCAVRDAGSLARAIDNLFASPGTLALARETAWRLGQSRFNWEREGSKVLGLVSRCLERSGGPST
jgi:glycosyltransferase involved in cell wall biosynthesis